MIAAVFKESQIALFLVVEVGVSSEKKETDY